MARDSAAAAARFLDHVDRTVCRLMSLPRLGRVVPELERHQVLRYREVVLSRWRLIYRVEPDRIRVLAVIDGSAMSKISSCGDFCERNEHYSLRRFASQER